MKYLHGKRVLMAMIAKVVADILSDVKKRGNDAVLEYTNKFDRMSLTDAERIRIK